MKFVQAFFVVFVLKTSKGHDLRAYLHTVDCSVLDPDIVKYVNCTFSGGENNMPLMNYQMEFKKEVVNVTGHVTGGPILNGAVKIMQSIDVDYCKSVARAKSDYTFQIIMNEIRRTSNLPTKCPLKANTVYAIRNFVIDSSKIPAYIPEMSFRFSIEFAQNNRKYMKLTTEGKIVKLTKKQRCRRSLENV